MVSACVEELPSVLTPQMACEFLQVRTSRPDRFITARKADGLRVLKVGRSLRILRTDFEKFIAAAASN